MLNPDGTENTSTLFIGNINPIRYRSYYYDTEIHMYYLQSRYYDPQTGRFISMDSIDYLDPETIGGANLYAYCNNNPVMYSDPSGHSIILTSLLIGLGIGIVVGGVAGGITAANNGQNIGLGILAGMGVGALFGTALGLATGLIGFGVGSIIAGGIGKGIISVLGGALIGFTAGSNLVNLVYYTFLAEPVALDENRIVNGKKASYYVTDDGGYRAISRWDRLNHVKAMTGETWYNLNAWRYNSEYSAHMYGWKAYADYGMFSNYRSNLKHAYIESNIWDLDLVVIPTILFGILGM